MGVRDKIVKAITEKMGIKAYHSSPHDFDKFDLAKIGTGEGAQVYGHGIYAAENPAVSGQGGQYWNQFLGRFEGTPEGNAAKRLRDAGFDREKAVRDYEAYLQSFATRPSTPEGRASAQRLYEKMMEKKVPELELLRSGAPVGPRTYEVNIKADPAQMLDWDRPLAQQGLDLKMAGEMAFPAARGLRQFQSNVGKIPGSDFYHELVKQTGDKPAASRIMQDAGIPGIKYLDEGSRGSLNLPALEKQFAEQQELVRFLEANSPTGPRMQVQQDNLTALEARLAAARKPPTSNYVVFDPANIEIMKKYGVVGAPAGTLGMGALADQNRYEVSQ